MVDIFDSIFRMTSTFVVKNDLISLFVDDHMFGTSHVSYLYSILDLKLGLQRLDGELKLQVSIYLKTNNRN